MTFKIPAAAVALAMCFSGAAYAQNSDFSGAFSFSRDGETITGTITVDGEVIVEGEETLTETQLAMLEDLEEAVDEGRVASADSVDDVNTTTFEEERTARQDDFEAEFGDGSDAREEVADAAEGARDTVEAARDDVRDTVEGIFN